MSRIRVPSPVGTALGLVLGAAAMLLTGQAAAAQATAAENADTGTQRSDEPEQGQDVVVSGRRISQASEAVGEDRITSTVAVTRDALLSAPSGISGLKMLESLPGFNVQTDGALGLYEFGNSVQARAFNLDQIGFVVDGVPMGRSDAFGGSPVFRYVDNENLGVVEASPGAGGVTMPTYSSLGPVVSYRSIVPQNELGAFVSQSFGDFDMKRTFVRVSTGKVGPLKAYVSRTKLNTDLWRGAGTVDREHWEAMALVDINDSSWARFKFVSNDFFDYDSPTLSRTEYYSKTPDLAGHVGRYRGYYGDPLPTYAPTVAGVPYSNSNYTYYYGQAINVRKDRLYAGTFHFGIADGVDAETTIYYEDKDGWGSSPDSYANTLTYYNRQRLVSGLALTAPRGTQFGVSSLGGYRQGILQSLHAKIGIHAIDMGIWAEDDRYRRYQRRQNTLDGSPASAPNYNELVYGRRDYRSKRATTQLFIRDRIELTPAFSIDMGIKALDLDYQQRGYRDYADYARTVASVNVAGWGPKYNRAHYRDFFLPTVGILYRFADPRTQLFASYAENMALPKGMDDIFSVAYANSPAVVGAPAPERSKNIEVGLRTTRPEFFASLTGYYTKFDNRIQSIASILPGTTNVTETFYQNVGAVKAYGAELLANYKPAFLHGAAYVNANVTYNHAQFQDNIAAAARTYLIAGKYLPDSAKWIVSGGLTVEPAPWFVANITGKYTSRRQSTFENTPGSSLPGFTVFSAYADIGDGFSIGPVRNARIRVNVDNLFDKDVLSYISSALTGDGLFRPLSPRTVQLTLSVDI
ncbi:TonB-dependent receptor [uncultured Sphingomonas sp.]|uniref:TonB-dependent receptor n=1 Tax=uncultured Sphingomonas sp. TaxID=158754 RepID=UPI0025D579D5|nr:TonB-dependent receptor [uncultured Sphingomonas sp.]